MFQKNSRKNQNKYFTFNSCFPNVATFMRCCVKICTARQATDDYITLLIRLACWINKATDTHSEYVIFTAFPRQHLFSESSSLLSLHLHKSLFLLNIRKIDTKGELPNQMTRTLQLGSVVYNVS